MLKICPKDTAAYRDGYLFGGLDRQHGLRNRTLWYASYTEPSQRHYQLGYRRGWIDQRRFKSKD